MVEFFKFLWPFQKSWTLKFEAKGYFVAFLENLNYNRDLHITLSVADARIGLLFKEGPT